LGAITLVKLHVFKVFPSSLTPLLKSLHWLKINQRIEYEILSLTYKVLTTAQPDYLRNLISVDSPHIETRSSSSDTISRPSSSSSLKITDHSLRYASSCLWNKPPASFRQPNPDHSFSHSSQPNSLKALFLQIFKCSEYF